MILVRLLRFPNLLVVALTQWLVAKRVLGTAYLEEGLPSVLSEQELYWLILATVCVTAAGYVINDLLDQSIDLINRPERVIVGERMTVGTVAWVAACLFFVGFGFSLLLALKKQELEWLWLYPFFGGLLWLYPRHLKVKPFVGNLFVAICCAGTAGLIWLAERGAWQQLDAARGERVSYILLLFMGYAFLATWIREIVKDYEDYTGDTQAGRVTVPVYLGLKQGKYLVASLGVFLTVLLISYAVPGFSPLTTNVALVLSAALAVPVIYLTYAFLQADSAIAYRRLSRGWKFFLLGGLLLLFFG